MSFFNGVLQALSRLQYNRDTNQWHIEGEPEVRDEANLVIGNALAADKEKDITVDEFLEDAVVQSAQLLQMDIPAYKNHLADIEKALAKFRAGQLE